jgi:ABC-type lipoprotein export system ATPase subunit
MNALYAENLSKVYRGEGEAVCAVRGATLQLAAGEFVLLMGPSGSGKTTLLSILGCILPPDTGRLEVCGEPVTWRESALPAIRRRCFGFIYQDFHLLAALTVRENVAIPLLISGAHLGEAGRLADIALERVGLAPRAGFRPSVLSGGEKQRVAIARAIAADAPVILGDEPTGNLDSQNGRRVISILRSLAEEEGKTVLVVSHDDRVIPFANRVLSMEDGEVRGS